MGLGIVAAALVVLGMLLFLQFSAENRRAYERLKQYPVQTLSTSFGKMSYVDEGSGPAVLISHGIFGGYDQAAVSLRSLWGMGTADWRRPVLAIWVPICQKTPRRKTRRKPFWNCWII